MFRYRSTAPGREGLAPIAVGSVSEPWRSDYPLARSAQPFYFQESVVYHGVEGPRSNEVVVTVPALTSSGRSGPLSP